MPAGPTIQATRAPTPRFAPRLGAAPLRLPAALEALLVLLAALLGRPRPTPAWHPLAPQPRPGQILSDLDHTHRGLEHPILWVIGPGPCRGMRPRPRALPHAQPRTARAPPRPPRTPSAANTPQPGPPTHARHHSDKKTIRRLTPSPPRAVQPVP